MGLLIPAGTGLTYYRNMGVKPLPSEEDDAQAEDDSLDKAPADVDDEVALVASDAKADDTEDK